MAKPWQNHGKIMARPWQNHWQSHGKTMAKPWQNAGKTLAKHGKNHVLSVDLLHRFAFCCWQCRLKQRRQVDTDCIEQVTGSILHSVPPCNVLAVQVKAVLSKHGETMAKPWQTTATPWQNHCKTIAKPMPNYSKTMATP